MLLKSTHLGENNKQMTCCKTTFELHDFSQFVKCGVFFFKEKKICMRFKSKHKQHTSHSARLEFLGAVRPLRLENATQSLGQALDLAESSGAVGA